MIDSSDLLKEELWKKRVVCELGLALTEMIVLLPVLLSLLLGLTTFLLSLKTWKEQHHLCRKEALQIQQDLSISLSQIMDLNFMAGSLQLAETTAKIALAAAITALNPKAIQVASKVLKQIQAKQTLLGLKQKTWIQQARVILLQQQMRLRKTISSSQSLSSVLSLRISSPKPLAIYPKKPHPRAPVYRLLEPFSETQSIEFSWKAHLLGKFPAQVNGLHDKVHFSKLVFEVRCRTTLEQKERQWIPRLMNAARPLLN